MKKIIFSISMIMVLSVGIFAEKLLSVSELPTSVTDFMKTYFPESQIVFAEYDDGKYDVKFTSNTDSDTLSGEAEFTKKGDWDKIEFYLGVPEEILPSEVLTTLRKNFSDSAIVSLERDFNGFEITLLDATEVIDSSNSYFSVSGDGKILDLDINHHHKKFDKDKFDKAKKYKESKLDNSTSSDSVNAQ